MTDHPIVLRALEAYVRRPMEGTALDVYVFAPCKQMYLDEYKLRLNKKKILIGKAL